MNNNLKDEISSALDKVKEKGKSRTDSIKEIIQIAISQASVEMKSGSAEMRSIVQEAISAVVEHYKDKGEAVKEEVTASIEGIINAVSIKKREEIKQLQDQVQDREDALSQEVSAILEDIQEHSDRQPANIKSIIDSAVESIKNSEEISLLQKRYAQLKSQLAIVQAHLTERYGGQAEEIRKYLDEARTWYEKSKENPEQTTSKIIEKQKEFEGKISSAGTLVAQKEKEVQGILKDLWKSLADIFLDREKIAEDKNQDKSQKE
jgi:gas vesicle protein